MSDPAPIDPAPRPQISLVSSGSAEPYRRLAEIFHDVLSEQSLDALLERIADTLAELIPYEDVHIYEADESNRQLRAVLARGEWADEVMSESFSFGEGITGWAVDHREAVLANQAHLDPRVRFVPGTPIEPEALIAVPLVARGQLKGTLNIYRVGEDAAFSDEEFLLAKRFGDAAALAIDNAHIRARLEHQAETDALTGLYNHRAFHDRLRQELLRASAARETVAVVMLDLDDFKKVNDVYGHGIGDHLLQQVADALRATVRASDVVCRVGGEEFAVILPAGDIHSSTALAERIGEQLSTLEAEAVGKLSVSTGIAVGPENAANPRELVACAEVAMMTAKARGKGLIVPFDVSERERPSEERVRRDDGRSIAHLKMLQSLSGKLSRLNDVAQIGLTISDELRLLIDYHNCRVFLREDDELLPVAFRGDLITADPGDPVKLLPTQVGRGITGRVAETGDALLVGDAAHHEFGEQIVGTAEIEESLLAVPLKYGLRVTGVIVISKLGLNQFDADDLRLLEVLAGHASVALENARLYEAQRHEAETAKALLALSRDLAEANGIADVAERVATGAADILATMSTSVWLQDALDGSLERLAAFPARNEPKAPRPHASRSSTSSRGSRGASRTRSIRPTTPQSRRFPRARKDVSRSPRSSSTAAGASSRRRSRQSRPPRTASSSFWPASRARPGSRCRPRRATRVSSARSSPPSRLWPMRSKRTTSTRRHTPAGSPTSRCESVRSSASSLASSSASSWGRSSTTSARSASRPGSS